MRALVLAILVLCGPAVAPAAAAGGAFAFELTAIEGGRLPLSRFAGRPLLVVNTASQCGFTYQYAALQRLWERYRDRRLVVLGGPSNDFGGQVPGSNAAMKTFCETNFDLDFPLTEKAAVTGPEAHPLFVWLREQLGDAARPRWNFHKVLIAPDGRPVAAWPSTVEPDSQAITQAVEKLLPAGS